MERVSSAFSPLESGLVSDVSCMKVGSADVVFLEFTSLKALRSTIKSHFSKPSFLILDPVWGCDGAYRQVTSVMEAASNNRVSSVSDQLVIALETKPARISDIYRKLVVHMESNHPEVVMSNVMSPQQEPVELLGDDGPNYNGIVWSNTYQYSYNSSEYGFSAIFTFSPSLYLDVNMTWGPFDIPTGVNDLNVTFFGNMDVNLTLDDSFNGNYATGTYEIFDIPPIPIPIAGIPLTLELAAYVEMIVDVTNTAEIYATIQAGGPFTVGVWYEDGFSGTASENFSVTDYIKPITATGQADVRLILTPVISVDLLEGVLSVGIEPPVSFDVSTNLELCVGYQVFYNVSVEATIDLEIISDTWTDNVYNNTLIWSDPCNNNDDHPFVTTTVATTTTAPSDDQPYVTTTVPPSDDNAAA